MRKMGPIIFPFANLPGLLYAIRKLKNFNAWKDIKFFPNT